MKLLENIAADFEERTAAAWVGNASRATILFCSCDPQLKKVYINVQSELDLSPLTQSNILLLKLNYRI